MNGNGPARVGGAAPRPEGQQTPTPSRNISRPCDGTGRSRSSSAVFLSVRSLRTTLPLHTESSAQSATSYFPVRAADPSPTETVSVHTSTGRTTAPRGGCRAKGTPAARLSIPSTYLPASRSITPARIPSSISQRFVPPSPEDARVLAESERTREGFPVQQVITTFAARVTLHGERHATRGSSCAPPGWMDCLID
jgi:hypothetical protein